MRVRLSLLLVFLVILLILTFGSEGIMCMIRGVRYRLDHCRDGNSDPELDIGFTVDRWIRETPAVRSAIIWRPNGSTAIGYTDWPQADKQQLATLYNALVSEGTVDLPVEPPIEEFGLSTEMPSVPGQFVVTSESFNLDIAKRTFFAHVAQSLRVEVQRLVSWSLHDFTPEELSYLFDSNHMYRWDIDQRRHVIHAGLGKATPGDPGRVYDLMRSNSLVQGTERATILATLEWCRRLTHDGGYFTSGGTTPDVHPGSRAGNEAHWQYEGFQPVERTFEGTVRLLFTAPRHWTNGCQGTTGFLRCILRTVNIPVSRESGCGHAIPYFKREHAFLSHGDDPYTSWMSGSTPPIPMSEILLSDSRLPGFFDDCEDVGLGVMEAVVRLLPSRLLELRCSDRDSGASHRDGEVFAALERYFTLAELEAGRLWERMDAEISRRGGCGGLI